MTLVRWMFSVKLTGQVRIERKARRYFGCIAT